MPRAPLNSKFTDAAFLFFFLCDVYETGRLFTQPNSGSPSFGHFFDLSHLVLYHDVRGSTMSKKKKNSLMIHGFCPPNHQPPRC